MLILSSLGPDAFSRRRFLPLNDASRRRLLLDRFAGSDHHLLGGDRVQECTEELALNTQGKVKKEEDIRSLLPIYLLGRKDVKEYYIMPHY